MRVVITDRFTVKMLPYTEGKITVYRSSPVDIKRALLRGAETYIYKEETARWIEDFAGIGVGITTKPLLLTRDEKTVMYVIFTYGKESDMKYVIRLVYEPVAIE